VNGLGTAATAEEALRRVNLAASKFVVKTVRDVEG